MFDAHCEYTTNKEYRDALRVIMNMDPTKMDLESNGSSDLDPETLDPETLDEYTFDSDQCSSFLDHVFTMTKDNAAFQLLYQQAASKMISLDASIGLAVLLSYDYLKFFLPCLREYAVSPLTFSEESDTFVSLQKKLN
jgi:hypothetical protein